LLKGKKTRKMVKGKKTLPRILMEMAFLTKRTLMMTGMAFLTKRTLLPQVLALKKTRKMVMIVTADKTLLPTSSGSDLL